MRREVGDILGFGLNRCDDSAHVYIESIKQVRDTDITLLKMSYCKHSIITNLPAKPHMMSYSQNDSLNTKQDDVNYLNQRFSPEVRVPLGVHEKFVGGTPNFKTNFLWSLGYNFDEILYLGVQFWYNFYKGVQFWKII
jgi:hypothetical protein